jgi:hypothetical protein
MGTIIGLLVIGVGALMVIKSENFLSTFGMIPWAESNLSGGSIMFYKLLGIVFVVGGILGVTGLFGDLVLWLLSPLFRSRV